MIAVSLFKKAKFCFEFQSIFKTYYLKPQEQLIHLTSIVTTAIHQILYTITRDPQQSHADDEGKTDSPNSYSMTTGQNKNSTHHVPSVQGEFSDSLQKCLCQLHGPEEHCFFSGIPPQFVANQPQLQLSPLQLEHFHRFPSCLQPA